MDLTHADNDTLESQHADTPPARRLGWLARAWMLSMQYSFLSHPSFSLLCEHDEKYQWRILCAARPNPNNRHHIHHTRLQLLLV